MLTKCDHFCFFFWINYEAVQFINFLTNVEYVYRCRLHGLICRCRPFLVLAHHCQNWRFLGFFCSPNIILPLSASQTYNWLLSRENIFSRDHALGSPSEIISRLYSTPVNNIKSKGCRSYYT